MFELQVDVHVSRETYESLCAGAHNDWLTLTWRVRLATSYFLLTSTWRLEGRQEGGRVMEFGVECEFSKESALSVWCCQGIVQQWTGDQLGWLFIFSCVYGDFFFTLWNAHLLNFLRIEAVSFCSHFPSPREKKKREDSVLSEIEMAWSKAVCERAAYSGKSNFGCEPNSGFFCFVLTKINYLC